jgi:hypothetical protein
MPAGAVTSSSIGISLNNADLAGMRVASAHNWSPFVSNLIWQIADLLRGGPTARRSTSA